MRSSVSLFRPSPRHRTLALFASFVVLMLAIVNLGAWYVFRSLNAILESELDRYLAGVSTLIAGRVPWQSVSSFIPGDEATRDYRQLASSLEEFTRSFDLSDVTVVDSTGKTLFSLSAIKPIGSENPAFQLDEQGLALAWAGKSSTGSAVRVRDAYLQTAFAPLRAPDGTVGAVVVVEADAAFYGSVATSRHLVYLVTLLSLAAIAALGLVFRRILNRFLQHDEALQRADKLATVGKLAASVTHEVRNPLGVISSTAQLIRKRLVKSGGDASFVELFGYILSEIERLDGILTRFLELARSPRLQYESVTVGELLTPTLSLIARDLERDGMQFSVDVKTPERRVEVDPGKIRQVLLNCLLNARDALRDSAKKELHVSAAMVGRAAAESLVVTIRDTGDGISDEVSGRLFEPFVTSKPTGSGIGLAVVKSILEEHQGQVTCESSRGVGTCFTLSIPAMRPEVVE